MYALRTDSPVKWTSQQERTLAQGFPWSSPISDTAAEYVSRTYTQFLWLPESIMPLRRLMLALLRVSALSPADFASGSGSESQGHPLHELLKPYLLTTRTAAEKWNSTVPKLLAGEEIGDFPEQEIMWFSLKYEKMNERTDDEDPDDAEDQWRAHWLQHMEQREAMIQILLCFLLLSLPGPPETEPTSPKVHSIDAPSPSPKKRKRFTADRRPISLDERLEAFMDRLSMWQLMGDIDETAGGDQSGPSSRPSPHDKGKGKAMDERDWMQKFCEDIVQPLFEDTLPEQCALLHHKVFQSSPFSDDSDFFSPPSSPKVKSDRHLTRASSTAPVISQPPAYTMSSQRQDRTLSRTSSLSASLQEERERERSKSLSVGPGNPRRRVLTREVSMSTAFKGKPRPAPAPRIAVTRGKDRKPSASASRTNSRRESLMRDQGVLLVEATPVKPKQATDNGRSHQTSQTQRTGGDDKLPSMMNSSRMAIEGDDDDDNWNVPSSPEITLLSLDMDDDEAGWQATPTKRPRAKRTDRD